MKVTREEKFTPITIVLETKEEADIMWHCLNSKSDSANEYMEKIGEKMSWNTKDAMWDSFDKAHGKPK